MNEWFKKNVGTIKEKWGKWSLVQKLICGAILLAVIAAVVLLARVSAKPSTVRLFNSPITDEGQRESIITRLDSDNVKTYVDSDGGASWSRRATNLPVRIPGVSLIRPNGHVTISMTRSTGSGRWKMRSRLMWSSLTAYARRTSY